MMKSIFRVAAVALVMTMAAGSAQADEKARTAELPPGLAAMGVTSQQIMTRNEAEQVRGEGLFLLGGLQSSIGAGALLGVPLVGNVAAAAQVNLNVGLGTSLLGGVGGIRGGHKHGKCY